MQRPVDKNHSKMGWYTAGVLSLVLAGVIGYNLGTGTNVSSGFDGDVKNVYQRAGIYSDRLRDSAFDAYTKNNYEKSAFLFKEFILQSYLEGRSGFYPDSIYNAYMSAINKTCWSRQTKDIYRDIAINARHSNELKPFTRSCRIAKDDITNTVQKLIYVGMSRALSDSSLSNRQKRRLLQSYENSTSRDFALHILKMVPLRHPENGRLTNIELLMRELTGDRFGATPMGDDPLGSVFDLITGRYRIADFVADNIVDNTSLAVTGRPTAPIQNEPKYYYNGRPVDPRYLDRDRFGNPTGSIREDQLRQMITEEERRRRDQEQAYYMQRNAQEQWRRTEQGIRQGVRDNVNNAAKGIQQGVQGIKNWWDTTTKKKKGGR